MNVQCSSFGCGKRLVAGSICKYFAHQTILSIKTREMRLWNNVLMNRSIIDDYPPYRITSLCDTGSFPCHSVKRSEEHTSELQSLMRISYAVFCLQKQTTILH